MSGWEALAEAEEVAIANKVVGEEKALVAEPSPAPVVRTRNYS